MEFVLQAPLAKNNMKKNPSLYRGLFFAALLLGATASGHAQTPDSRIWPRNTKTIQMLNGLAWMEVPRAAQQSGNLVRLGSVSGFRPNINALFEATNLTISGYRTAALPVYRDFGFRVIKERVIYGRVWEIESVTPATGLRYYQRIFRTDGGVVVVTATAKSKNWQHSTVKQLIDAMRTLDVL